MEAKPPNFDDIFSKFKQKNNNNIAALLKKGKEEVIKPALPKQNHYEMDSEEIKEAQFLFNNPVSHVLEPPKLQKQPERMQQELSKPKSILKESSMVQEPAERKDKSVSFYQEGHHIYSIEDEKKWSHKIEGQKKGKFQQDEHRALCDAVGQFLAVNQIQIDEFKAMISEKDKEKGILRRQKFFNLLSSVLPNRSPMSCYKYILRNFNAFNHQGPWKHQQVEQLLALVDKYGRKWKLISRELKRTSDNVYDKYRSLGQEGLEERAKGIWKLRELVVLLTQLQNHSKTQFLNSKIKQVLAEEEKHDKKEQAQFGKHKYNTKNFVFHNIEVIKAYINVKQIKSINLQTVRWKKLVKQIPTRSIFDCRNKIVQVLQVLFRDNSSLDQSLVDYLQAQKVSEQAKINWKTWKSREFTPQQAKNRFMILKKIVEGRSHKPFELVVKQIRAKIAKQKSASLQKNK